MARQLPDDLGDANNILVLAPPGAEFSDDACSSLLTAERSGQLSLISVTVGQSPAQRLQFWETHVGDELPDRTAVVSVGDAGDAASSTLEDEIDPVDQITVRSIADPADTLTLGIELTWWLSQWTTGDDRVVGCVYTLSELMQQAGHKRTVELLLRLFDWTKRFDATIHYHLDPEAHDDAVVELIKPLFDAVIESEPTEDGRRESEKKPQDWTATLENRFFQEPTLSQDVVFDLLSDRRRRELLYCLQALDPGESATVAELLDRLVESERQERARESPDLRGRVDVTLRHQHLPRLANAGVVDYGDDAVVVRENWGGLLEFWTAQAAFME
jgi:hypothetical protein